MKYIQGISQLCLMLLAIATAVATTHASELPLTVQAMAAERESTFEQFEDKLESIEEHISEENWPEAENQTREAINDWIWLQSAFPLSAKGTGRLKDRIWNPGSDFSAQMEQVLNNLKGMQNALSEQNTRYAERYWKKVEKSCRGCHRQFRSFW